MRLVHDDLRDMLHQCNTLRTEMTHFLCNFQYYIMFEVLETGYMNFSSRVLGTAAPAGSKAKPCHDMDDIIEAHTLYLQYILRASLLEDPTKPTDERPPTLTLILSMLDAIEKFDALVLDIFEQSELISNRRHAAHRRSKKGGWGKTEHDEAADEEFRQTLRIQLGPQLTQMHQAYWKRFGMLFKLVKAAATVGVAGIVEEQDNNMRQHLTHLAFRLDFNQFYTRSIELRDAAASRGVHDLSTPAKRS
jgi:gamma-tubulin complex component 3